MSKPSETSPTVRPAKLRSGIENAYYRPEIESLRARLLIADRKHEIPIADDSASSRPGLLDRARGLLELPVRELDWHQLEFVADQLGEEVADRLEAEIADQAKCDLESGQTAASVVLQGLSVKPFDHARLLELRSSVRAEWQPRPGIESILVDHLVQAQWAYEHWIATHMSLSAIPQLPAPDMYTAALAYGARMPKLQDSVEAESHSLMMATRWQNQVLRIIRNLRDLRKVSPVIVQNAGQVNVGQQQVNVAISEGD